MFIKSNVGQSAVGNGKIDHTPSPVSLKKIKRVGFDVFCCLKEIVNNNVKVVGRIPPRRDRKKSIFRRKRPSPVVTKPCADEYEPSSAVRLFNSSSWQWHRAAEWDRYINNEE